MRKWRRRRDGAEGSGRHSGNMAVQCDLRARWTACWPAVRARIASAEVISWEQNENRARAAMGRAGQAQGLGIIRGRRVGADGEYSGAGSRVERASSDRSGGKKAAAEALCRRQGNGRTWCM